MKKLRIFFGKNGKGGKKGGKWVKRGGRGGKGRKGGKGGKGGGKGENGEKWALLEATGCHKPLIWYFDSIFINLMRVADGHMAAHSHRYHHRGFPRFGRAG